MYNTNNIYASPYHNNTPTMYSTGNMCCHCNMWPCSYYANMPMHNSALCGQLPKQYLPYTANPKGDTSIILKDYGREPFVVDIEAATKQNENFRLALWTGCHLQLTLMSIDVGEDIGLETHPNLDQFIRIEEGQGLVQMGDSKDNLDFQAQVYGDYAIFIPAGKWHNLINTGDKPLKLYSIYAPPEHPYGTVDETKKDAEERERY